MLREKLVAWLAQAFTWAALKAAPRPPLPLNRQFRVTSGKRTSHPVEVQLLFVPAEVGEWHSIALVAHAGFDPLLVDSGVGRCYIWHIDATHRDRIVAAYDSDYIVTVTANPKGHMDHSTIGPVTCVTLAKRLIGVHNPGIVTSRQLLALLWEMRDGRDQEHR